MPKKLTDKQADKAKSLVYLATPKVVADAIFAMQADPLNPKAVKSTKKIIDAIAKDLAKALAILEPPKAKKA